MKRLTVAEIADRTRTTPVYVATAIRRGELPAVKVARRWLATERDVVAWLDAQPTNDAVRDAMAGAS